jgi:PEP-CTERM motif
MRIKKLAAIAGMVVAGALSLPASTVYQYSFGGLGSLGSSSHVFAPVSGPSSYSITAHGGTFSGIPVNLYSKGPSYNFANPWSSSNHESGLGLTNDRSGSHEITPGSYIVLDLANLTGFSASSLGLYTTSTEHDDRWAIWGWNGGLNGALAAYLGPGVIHGSNEGLQSLSSFASDRWLGITATRGDILLGAFTAAGDPSATPEPSSVGLMGLAAIGMSLLVRKRFSRSA